MIFHLIDDAEKERNPVSEGRAESQRNEQGLQPESSKGKLT